MKDKWLAFERGFYFFHVLLSMSLQIISILFYSLKYQKKEWNELSYQKSQRLCIVLIGKNYWALLGISQMFQDVEWVGEENISCSQTELAAGKLPSWTHTFRNCVRRLSCPIALWTMVNQISLYCVAAEIKCKTGHVTLPPPLQEDYIKIISWNSYEYRAVNHSHQLPHHQEWPEPWQKVI